GGDSLLGGEGGICRGARALLKKKQRWSDKLSNSWHLPVVGGDGVAMVLERPLPGALKSVVAVFFFSSRRRHTRFKCDWSSDVCSSDLRNALVARRDAGVSDAGARRT